MPVCDRVLVLGLDGASYSVLLPLVAEGLLPNLAATIEQSALVSLRSTEPCVTPVAWTSFQTGADPAQHGIWDYRYLDARAPRLALNDARRIAIPTLYEHLEGHGRSVVSLNLPMSHPGRSGSRSLIVGGLEAPSAEAALATAPRLQARLRSEGISLGLDPIWRRRPHSFEELENCVSATCRDFRDRARAAVHCDQLVDWQLMFVQFQALDTLQHRAWHLLGVDGACAGPSRWVGKVREALVALDRAVGELQELASRRGAAVVVCSDHGFGPFREKISLPELLRRRGLLTAATRASHWNYRLARWGWKLRRLVPRGRQRSTAGVSRPLTALLPVDWKRSVAVAPHGNLAALVYLNTEDRFGSGPLATFTQREQAAAETLAALREARHPETGEPLFTDAYRVDQRFAINPVEQGVPDIIGIPAPGFHTRHKFDRAQRLLQTDCDLTGTHRADGVLMISAPGVVPGRHHAAALRDVAPTILEWLGLPVAPTMTGQSIAPALRETSPQPTEPVLSRAIASEKRHVPAEASWPALTAAQHAAVEQRLQQLGYVD